MSAGPAERRRRAASPARPFMGDQSALSALGAIGLAGGVLSFAIAGFVMAQGEMLQQSAEPAASDVVDSLTVQLSTGEVLGHVNRDGQLPVLDELIVTAKLGLATQDFDVRSLTLRVAGTERQTTLGHAAANATLQGSAFDVVPVRDEDGSLGVHKMQRGDRIDLELDLAAANMELGRGEQLTIYFQTDGSTTLRLRVTAPASFGGSQWVELERELLQHG